MDELVKQLQYCATHDCMHEGEELVGCTAPIEEREGCCTCNDVLMMQAADAIEELSADCDMYRKGMTDEHNKAARLLWDKEHCWIPVTERLPEQGKQVLVTGIEAIGNVQIYGVKQLDGDVWRPTSAPSCYWEHWMPLPEPPKEE